MGNPPANKKKTGNTNSIASDLLKDILLLIYFKDVIHRSPNIGNTEKIQNSIYIAPDILKEIFLRLPLRSLVRFKTVSKEWRLILESKSFIDMHLNFQKSGKKSRKILAGYYCNCCDGPSLSPVSGFEGGEEIVYLHCDTARPSMSCDGLVCIPEPDWVNVLNPSTGELRKFLSGPDPVPSAVRPRHSWFKGKWLTHFPGYWAMGFGRDKVTGSYKVVRMCFDPVECHVLAVETGEWRRLSPPPYVVDPGRRSAYVNGSIYWLEVMLGYQILALDLHTQEFHDVKSLPLPYSVTDDAQLLNLDDRLALSMTRKCKQELEIWFMDSKDERWSKTYSISLAAVVTQTHLPCLVWWFTPVMISEEGHVLICDEKKSLFKYYPHNNVTRPLSSSTCWVISPYLENLVRLKI